MEGAELTEFAIKDSGTRQEFAGGMVRDTTEGKTNFLNVRFGPMLRRWAEHLTKGRDKYPDPTPGVPNWTLASGVEEYLRAKESAARHFEQWLAGDRDEDHAAGVFFNINLAEYVLGKMDATDPGLGAVVGDSTRPEPDDFHMDDDTPRFAIGDRVQVRTDDSFSGLQGRVAPEPPYVQSDIPKFDYYVVLDSPDYSLPLGFNEDELLPA